ncbi:MAG TPA: cupin domain-containing protein, partial [Gaiellales bacterium]
LGRAAGSERTGLKHVRIDAGKLGAPPHCHSAEEEMFVVLAGDGTLLLGDDEHPVRTGSLVARPAGTAIAHAFRAGPAGITHLAYGTREANDICFYPRSGKVMLGGVGVIGRIEQLDYWDGED